MNVQIWRLQKDLADVQVGAGNKLCSSLAAPIILNACPFLRRRETVKLTDVAKSLGSNLSLLLRNKCLCLT